MLITRAVAICAMMAWGALALADSHSPEEEDLYLFFLDSVEFLFLAVPIALIFLGLIVGRHKEKKHYQSIQRREKALLHIPTTTAFLSDDKEATAETCELAFGATVVSGDKFKDFLSLFRHFVGGEMKSYASLADRARREAILRMKESCPDADEFINCRIQTSSVTGIHRKKFTAVEVIAYATAVRYKK